MRGVQLTNYIMADSDRKSAAGKDERRQADVKSSPARHHNSAHPTHSSSSSSSSQERKERTKTENCRLQKSTPPSSPTQSEATLAEKKAYEDLSSKPFLDNASFRMIYISTAVISVVCAISVYQSYGSLFSNPPDRKVLEFLEKHGYLGDQQIFIKEHKYGSPNLLTQESKQKLVDEWSQRDLHQPETGGFGETGDGKKDVDGGVNGGEGNKDGGERFVVVFDAGSTGTRLHVYSFKYEHGGLKLSNELFQSIKPGLSEFVRAAQRGAATLQPMLEAAMRKVPAPLHASTPLLFKATAGFRLLPPAGANGLLVEIRKQLAQTDFLYRPEDVDILSSEEEGLYAWITINYLTGKMDGNSKTGATLDLGGASMQLTYQPPDKRKVTEKLHDVELMGHDFALYTHSYLGVGLLAARNSTFLKGKDGVLTGDCLPAGYSGVFTFGGQSYPVRGLESPSRDRCWEQVGAFLSSRHLGPPWELVGRHHHSHFYLISYFHEVLTWAHVLSENEMEKVLTVQDFYKAGYAACKRPSADTPFLCQDLTYITRLLGEGFMLWNRPLHVVTEIKSVETSWALGAALKELSKTYA